MTVQLSVTVWTVICFILLMIILKNLLFEPVLKVLDSRRERIQKAREKQEGYEKKIAEHDAELTLKQEEYLREKQKKVRQEVDELRAELKERVEQAQEERLKTVDSYRERIEAEHEEIKAALSLHAAELAVTFAESIAGGGEKA